jgi:hypothetical protein
MQAGAAGRSMTLALDAIIDNGNHLLLSGNKSALSYLETVNALDELIGPDTAAFPFVDVATRERWTIELNKGPMPWWILNKDRRVPGTRLSEYLTGLEALECGQPHRQAAVCRTGRALRAVLGPVHRGRHEHACRKKPPPAC